MVQTQFWQASLQLVVVSLGVIIHPTVCQTRVALVVADDTRLTGQTAQQVKETRAVAPFLERQIFAAAVAVEQAGPGPTALQVVTAALAALQDRPDQFHAAVEAEQEPSGLAQRVQAPEGAGMEASTPRDQMAAPIPAAVAVGVGMLRADSREVLADRE